MRRLSRVQFLVVGLHQIRLGDLMKVHPSVEVLRGKEVSLGLEGAEVDLPNHLDNIGSAAVVGWDSRVSDVVVDGCLFSQSSSEERR